MACQAFFSRERPMKQEQLRNIAIIAIVHFA